MTATTTLTWAQVPRPLRLLARWITIAQAAGYGVSIAFARQMAARFTNPAGADSHELLLAAHSHLLGMTALFALSGACYALCAGPREPLKSAAIVTPFAAIMVAFTAVWLMRFSPDFVMLLAAAQVVMAVVFYYQIVVTLRELRAVNKSER
jgi:hypothetical protein